MSKCLILDIETLDNKPSAVVTSLACIVFDPTDIKPFDELVKDALVMKFDWQEQIKCGRTTSASTLDFWRKPENKDAFEMCVAPKSTDVSLSTLNDTLYGYLTKMGYDTSDSSNGHAYCRGNSFDFPIIENIYDSYGWQEQIHFWNHRDVRTAIDSIAGYIDPEHKNRGYPSNFNIEGMIKHRPDHDCARDIMQMQYVNWKLCTEFLKD